MKKISRVFTVMGIAGAMGAAALVVINRSGDVCDGLLRGFVSELSARRNDYRYPSLAPFVEKEIRVGNFSHVAVSGGVSVEYTEGLLKSVRISAREDIMPYVKVLSQGGKLSVSLDLGGLGREVQSSDVKVSLSSPVLNTVKVSMGCMFTALGTVRGGGNLDVRLDTGSAASFDDVKVVGFYGSAYAGSALSVDRCEAATVSLSSSAGSAIGIERLVASQNTDIIVSAGSALTLKGKSKAAKIMVSGGSAFEGPSFAVERAEIDVTGASSAEYKAVKSNENCDFTSSACNVGI